ncbi:LysM peptidoglycan-binding domain-containing protein (plasmid) [Rhodococcus pseudokoreensis]|uniref:LysM peptidoglycan-binding domain-containing protein n=1 Tax=Rhodococcus pseudokoreensis TaxID=2811421 RepID=A0A974VXF8_9NOCA|nr:LysM domain-containing protein [Rhodococcus pseudokoreensis]QSE87151.1 LysM peptidoglycan-binding domain-containing protein [Rhodococcus pseudokoreensis]
MNTAAHRLKGLGYLLTLLTLLIGIPTALYLFQGNPLAPLAELTSFNALKELLLTQDDGTLFITALTLLGWSAWATFAYTTIIEIVAAARGARPREIKGLQLQQRSAAALVGGALMLITAGTATASPIADMAMTNGPAHTAPAHAAPVDPSIPARTNVPTWTKEPATTPTGDTITTKPGDTLWSLAEHHLGDGTRYPEIRDLNRHIISDDNWLHAGWALTLPAEPTPPVTGAYTVQPGDTLWDLAEQHLRDGTRWTEIRGVDGPLTNDLLVIGQQLVIQPDIQLAPPPASISPQSQGGPEPAPAPAPAPEVADVPASAPAPAPEVAAPESAPEIATPPTASEVGPDTTTAPNAAPETDAVPTPAPEATPTPAPAPETTPLVPTAVLGTEAPTASVPETAPAPAPDSTLTHEQMLTLSAAPPAEASPPVPAEPTQPSLVVPNIPEQAEMVPGGDEMAQAEARAAAEAAARVFGMTLDPSGQAVTPSPARAPVPPAVPPAPAPAAATPAPGPAEALAPPHTPATTAEVPAPTTNKLTPPPTQAQESETTNTQSNTAEMQPENTPAPIPEIAPEPGNAPPAPPVTDLPPTHIPLDTSPVPTPDNTASTTDLNNEDAGISSSTLVGVSALAAVALLAALRTYRRRQQHRRQRGERIPLPTGPAAVVEETVRSSADPEILNTLDAALRHLADHCRTNKQPLPAVLGVFIHPNTIELALLDTIELPAPWARAGDTNAWSINADATIDAPPTAISPYPSLVELGDLPDNSRILLNLEQIGHLGINADPDTAQSILRALAVFLAFSPLADNLKVTLVGFCEDLPALVDTGHLSHTDSADNVLTRLARAAATDAETLKIEGIPSISSARTTYDDSEMTTPEIILLAEPLTPKQRDTFTEILAAAPRIAVAAITASDSTADWTLTATGTAPARLARGAGAAFDLTPATLTKNDYAALLELLDTARTEPKPTIASLGDMWTAEVLDLNISEAATIDDVLAAPAAAPHRVNPPATTDTGDTDVDDTTPDTTPDLPYIWIRLLGTPQITPLNGTDAPGGREPSLTEIGALLVTHPGILNHDLDAKIWPNDPLNRAPTPEQPKKKAVRRQNQFTRLRTWLGETTNGDLAFPKSGDRTGRSGYRLHPDVTTDWDTWNQLLQGHPANATDTNLHTATTLITGQPFTHTDPTKYAWAEHLQHEMLAALTDALEEHATRMLHRGDTRTAHQLATRGLNLNDAHEGLWRIAIIATHARDDINTTQALIDELLTTLTELEEEPEEETAALLKLLADFHDTTGDRPYSISAAS